MKTYLRAYDAAQRPILGSDAARSCDLKTFRGLLGRVNIGGWNPRAHTICAFYDAEETQFRAAFRRFAGDGEWVQTP